MAERKPIGRAERLQFHDAILLRDFAASNELGSGFAVQHRLAVLFPDSDCQVHRHYLGK